MLMLAVLPPLILEKGMKARLEINQPVLQGAMSRLRSIMSGDGLAPFRPSSPIPKASDHFIRPLALPWINAYTD